MEIGNAATPAEPGTNQRRLLIMAAVSATVVVASVVIGTILGELPEALWFLLVPIGMFGAGLVGATCLAMALVRSQRP